MLKAKKKETPAHIHTYMTVSGLVYAALTQLLPQRRLGNNTSRRQHASLLWRYWARRPKERKHRSTTASRGLMSILFFEILLCVLLLFAINTITHYSQVYKNSAAGDSECKKNPSAGTSSMNSRDISISCRRILHMRNVFAVNDEHVICK